MKDNSKEKNNKTIARKILKNLIYVTIITIYLIFFNMYVINLGTEIFSQCIKIASFVLLIITIIIFEIAYKKDNDEIAISGIEILVLAIYSILVQYISKTLKIEEKTYLTIGTYASLIYYFIKNIVIYTREKKKELDNLSDIKEIVKNEPIKKETKRKNKAEE